jgi:hypothetical protein
MISFASYEITVLPARGMYLLGYYSADAAKFFLIEQFANGGLAHAAARRMNQERGI